MNSSIFNTGAEDEDPWSTWTNDINDPDRVKSTSPILSTPLNAPPNTSTYLTSSQLLQRTAHADTNTNTSLITNIPESYKDIHAHLIDQLKTVNDLEIHIFQPLITRNHLTNYQKSRILDLAYDNNLMPISIANNFYLVLGLIALEIDVPGSADYVTLQFRLNSLPDLPRNFVASIVNDEDDEEGGRGSGGGGGRGGRGGGNGDGGDVSGYHPLLANRTEDNERIHDWNVKDEDNEDPILTDHSTSRLIEPDGSDGDVKDVSGGGGSSGRAGGLVLPENVVSEDTVDERYIEKYVNDIRDKFKPLIEDRLELVTIKEMPEKEGILFKHINYIVTHNLHLGRGTSSHGQKKVVRRYSDFVWYVYYPGEL